VGSGVIGVGAGVVVGLGGGVGAGAGTGTGGGSVCCWQLTINAIGIKISKTMERKITRFSF
jgi:hypothetical protein